MSYYDSPSFYIDFAQLPPPDVIETIDYEVVLANYKARVGTALPSLQAALNLEQSPTNVILETEAYGEVILRTRVNAAARAVMLPFSTGADLDNLGALYNVIRLVNIDGSSESDARFRRRIQLAAETFSTCGTEGSYIFHALTADPSILDASAIKTNDRGGIQVTIMNTVTTPIPTVTQLNNVLTYLQDSGRRVLTDVVKVAGPTVLTTTIDADLALYPGPDAAVVMKNINAALVSYRSRVARLGYGVERSAVISALYQEGVQNVTLRSPSADLNPGLSGCVLITSASVNVLPGRTF